MINGVTRSGFRQILCVCLILFSSLSIQAAEVSNRQNKDQRALVFGLLPSESPIAKFKRYAPLRDYLQMQLNRRVVLETAKSFQEFQRRTSRGKYDFLETAPHFVLAAIDSGQYVVLTTITQPLSVQLVVKANGAIQNVQQLQGKIIATPSPRAIITRIGKEMLGSSGLQGDHQPRFRAFKTHNAAYEAVLGGQADAALISVNIYNKAIKQNKAIRSIATSIQFPNMSIIAGKHLSNDLRSQIQQVLAAMVSQAQGRRVLSAISYPGYRLANAQEFDVLRKYSIRQ